MNQAGRTACAKGYDGAVEPRHAVASIVERRVELVGRAAGCGRVAARSGGAGLTSFYSNLLTKNLAFGSADAASAAVSVYTAGGTAQAVCNTPYQVIDIQAAATAATFNFTSIFIGDTNMILGAGQVPVDTFFAAVQNRFVRFTTLQRGQTMQAGFINVTIATTPRALTIIAKVRSYRRS